MKKYAPLLLILFLVMYFMGVFKPSGGVDTSPNYSHLCGNGSGIDCQLKRIFAETTTTVGTAAGGGAEANRTLLLGALVVVGALTAVAFKKNW